MVLTTNWMMEFYNISFDSLSIEIISADCILSWSRICSLAARCRATYEKNEDLSKYSKILLKFWKVWKKVLTIDSDNISFTCQCINRICFIGIYSNAECNTRIILAGCYCRKFYTTSNGCEHTTRLIWTKLKESMIDINNSVIARNLIILSWKIFCFES